MLLLFVTWVLRYAAHTYSRAGLATPGIQGLFKLQTLLVFV